MTAADGGDRRRGPHVRGRPPGQLRPPRNDSGHRRARATDRERLDHHDRYLIDRLDSSQLGFVSMGLFRSLEADGFHVLSPPDALSDFQYGSSRVAAPAQSTVSRSSTWPNPGQVPPGAGWSRPRSARARRCARARAEHAAPSRDGCERAPHTGLGPHPVRQVFADSSGASTGEVANRRMQHGVGSTGPVARAWLTSRRTASGAVRSMRRSKS